VGYCYLQDSSVVSSDDLSVLRSERATITQAAVADALDYNGPILFRALKAAVAETGHQHGVDDVDDAVRLVDIRDRDHRLAALSVRPE
jgi:hypothetical protein